MTMLAGVHHIAVVVRDLEASVAWYVEHLGFARSYTYGWPGVRVAFIERPGLRLEFFQNDAAAPMDEDRRTTETNLRIGGINHFAIEVPDLDAAVSALRDKGVAIVSPARDVPNSGGSRFAFIHDNERMLVELFQV